MVFYDPTNTRRKLFGPATWFIVTAVSTAFMITTVSILVSPALPRNQGVASTGLLPKISNVTPEPTSTVSELYLQNLFLQARNNLNYYVTTHGTTQEALASPQGAKRVGFFVNWDEASLNSLKQNSSQIDVLVPEWVHLANPSGEISFDTPDRQTEVINFVKANKPTLSIVPLINNFNSRTSQWDQDLVSSVLSDKSAETTNIASLLNYVKSNNFQGITIDYENIPDTAQPALLQYVRDLTSSFHSQGLQVYVAVPLWNDSFDYYDLARSADFLIAMAYDQHWDSSDPGPVASQDWFQGALANFFDRVPPSNAIIALGNYGYDWQNDQSTATTDTFQQALQTASDAKAIVSLDPTALNPTYTYNDTNNQNHYVWYLDAATTFNQKLVADSYKPYGYALWRMGSEDPTVWSVLSGHPALTTMQYGYDLTYEGTGEILKVVATPAIGQRQITTDPVTGFIDDEKITAFPSAYVIQRSGGVPKNIALTFDDGPDPSYTPQILDILKKYNVPATFFVIGLSAEANPNILRQIYNEGHDIGSHTFTHPNISQVSAGQVDLELTAVERLLESTINHQTLLFRPPYGEDDEPSTPSEAAPLSKTGGLGYYTVGMNVDPGDWSLPGANQIVTTTVSQVESGMGHIILLHDGGGNRSQTVAALPQIIQTLQKDGYRFVAVSNLIGISRDAAMPVTPQKDLGLIMADNLAFSLISFIYFAAKIFFGLGIILGIARFLFILTLAVIQKIRGRRQKFDNNYQPEVTVILPAYNEEKVIVRSVESLLKSTYNKLKIIVVDDGSRDRTFQVAKAAFANNRNVAVYTQENNGKAVGLNFGLAKAKSEIIVALDADTLLDRQAISKLVRHFSDPKIGAVAGNAKVGNRINLLTNLQALEYTTGQNLDRRAFDILNCITVVPGAIGAWRKSAINVAGGYSTDTLAEDADLTIRIIKAGYKVVYEEEAIGYTEAPDSIRTFLKQRFRWMYGTIQTVWKNKRVLLNPRYKTLGFVALPNVIIFQILFPLISPFMDLLMLQSIVWVLWQKTQHPSDYPLEGFKSLLFYYALFLAVDYLTSLTAFLLEKKENKLLLVWLVTQRFFYRQLMYYVAVKSVLTAIEGKVVGWGKFARKASVTAIPG